MLSGEEKLNSVSSDIMFKTVFSQSSLSTMTLLITSMNRMASLGLYTFIAQIFVENQLGDFVPSLIWVWGLAGVAGALFTGKIIDKYLTPWITTSVILIALNYGFLLFDIHILYIILSVFFYGGWQTGQVLHPSNTPLLAMSVITLLR